MNNLLDYFKADPSAIGDLKKLTASAVDAGQDTFEFRGQKMVTRYAEYLIIFLDNNGVS